MMNSGDEFRKVIQNKRTMLIQNIANPTEIVDKLYEKELIAENVKQEILAEKTQNDQVRKILDTVVKCGHVASKIFYSILHETCNDPAANIISQGLQESRPNHGGGGESGLKRDLKENLPKQRVVPIIAPLEDGGPNKHNYKQNLPKQDRRDMVDAASNDFRGMNLADKESLPDMYHNASNDNPKTEIKDKESLPDMDHNASNDNLKTVIKAQEGPCDVSVQDDAIDFNYDCNGKGYLLILNSETNRKGTEADVDRLKVFFENNLHFEYHDARSDLGHDLSTEEVYDELDKVRMKLDSSYYCFICVILSHGDESGIETNNGFISEEDIRHTINNRNTPNFKGRPKIFLIQACRGNKEDKIAFDNKEHVKKEIPTKEEKARYIEVPTDADTLFAFPTTPGYKAARDETRGSWFIEECIKVFDEYHKSEHLEEMLITMRQRVARKQTKDGFQQMPCVWSTLTKRMKLTEYAEA